MGQTLSSAGMQLAHNLILLPRGTGEPLTITSPEPPGPCPQPRSHKMVLVNLAACTEPGHLQQRGAELGQRQSSGLEPSWVSASHTWSLNKCFLPQGLQSLHVERLHILKSFTKCNKHIKLRYEGKENWGSRDSLTY